MCAKIKNNNCADIFSNFIFLIFNDAEERYFIDRCFYSNCSSYRDFNVRRSQFRPIICALSSVFW